MIRSVSRQIGSTAALTVGMAIAFTVYFFHSAEFFKVQTQKSSSKVIAVEGNKNTNKTSTCKIPALEPVLLIYNRLPKAGSSSMTTILQNTSKTNHFQLEYSDHFSIGLAERLSDPFLVRALNASSQGKRVVYVNHMYYMGEDFHDIAPAAPRPAYIQLVREPISRTVSEFYFMKQASQGQKADDHMKDLMRNSGLNSSVYDVRECLESAKRPSGCTANNAMTRYFCGAGRECANVSSPAAFASAVTNLDRYLFVGILEEFHLTLSMLEKLLPAYFKGVGSIKIPQANKGTQSKPIADDKSLEMIRSWNANDLALYNLIVERFQREVKACLDDSLFTR